MISDFAEFYFLTGCYSEGVDETKVYTLLLTKVISNFTPPVNYSVSEMVQLIQDKYRIEVPPTFVKSIIKGMQGTREELYIRNDTITIIRIPKQIAEQTETLQKEADQETRLIFDQFNKHLVYNDLPPSSYRDFQTAFLIYCNRISEILPTPRRRGNC